MRFGQPSAGYPEQAFLIHPGFRSKTEIRLFVRHLR